MPSAAGLWGCQVLTGTCLFQDPDGPPARCAETRGTHREHPGFTHRRCPLRGPGAVWAPGTLRTAGAVSSDPSSSRLTSPSSLCHFALTQVERPEPAGGAAARSLPSLPSNRRAAAAQDQPEAAQSRSPHLRVQPSPTAGTPRRRGVAAPQGGRPGRAARGCECALSASALALAPASPPPRPPGGTVPAAPLPPRY